MCVCVGVGASVYSSSLSRSLFSQLRQIKAGARSCLYVYVKKGRKQVLLSLFQYRSLLFSLTHYYVSVCFVWFGCMCVRCKWDENSGNLFGSANVFLFLQQNSVISFLFCFFFHAEIVQKYRTLIFCSQVTHTSLSLQLTHTFTSNFY